MSNNKQQKTNKVKKTKAVLSAIISVFMLLVALSIVYSSYVVWFGTDGSTPKLLLAPQIVFVAIMLVTVFVTAAKNVSTK